MSGATVRVTGTLCAVVLTAAFGARSVAAGDRQERTKIAFSCRGQICTMNGDGGAQYRLTHDTHTVDGYPSWSPDGSRLVFTAGLGDKTVLYTMNADGSDRERLTPSLGDDAMAAWSPDGGTIALDDNLSGRIELMNADGSGRRPLTSGEASLPTWSPDGSKLAFVSGNGRNLALTSGDVYVINADGSGQRLLTRNGTFPAWSPDGGRIAFLRNTRHRSSHVGVWIMNADGTGKHRIWSHSLEGGGISWSPDGTRIALTNEDGICAINSHGGSFRQLERGWGGGADDNPAWQPSPGSPAPID